MPVHRGPKVEDDSLADAGRQIAAGDPQGLVEQHDGGEHAARTMIAVRSRRMMPLSMMARKNRGIEPLAAASATTMTTKTTNLARYFVA